MGSHSKNILQLLYEGTDLRLSLQWELIFVKFEIFISFRSIANLHAFKKTH